MCVCTHTHAGVNRGQRQHWIPEAGVRGSCEQPDMELGIELWSSARAARTKHS